MVNREIPATSRPQAQAANDWLRSEFVRSLILRNTEDSTSATANAVPRVIVQFWDDTAQVPDDVQECLDTWAALEPFGFERILFNDSTARRYIADQFTPRHVLAFSACKHPAMRADYFRLCFTLRNGGLYVDADDEYLARPIDGLLDDDRLRLHALCYNIATDSMVDPFEMAERGEDANLIYYVNNNPLIASANHPLIAHALERATTRVLALAECERDIQSMTGPGNLTASLVEHALELQEHGADLDVALIRGWEDIAKSKWPLDYRSDNRNWRNWIRSNE